MTNISPELAKAARATYERWIADVRDLEPAWDDLDQSHRDRLIDATAAGFASLIPIGEGVVEAMAAALSGLEAEDSAATKRTYLNDAFTCAINTIIGEKDGGR